MSKNEEKPVHLGETAPATPPKPVSKKDNALEMLLGGAIADRSDMSKGLANLATLPDIADGRTTVRAVYNKPFTEGVMGFRREGGSLGLTVACGTAQVRSVPLGKYVALVERMYDPDRPAIVLQNPVEQDRNHAPRGQLLGRILPASSALVVGLGYSGRIVEKLEDFVKIDVYYLSRSTMAAFYLCGKLQLSTEDTLDELIAAYEGWYKFGIPLDPANPHCLEEAVVKAPF